MNTINHSLKYVKEPIDTRCHKGVYLIPCSCGKPHIGETGRSVLRRIQEHATDIKHNRFKTSSLDENSNKTNYHICIENSYVVAKIDHYRHTKFREAIEIGKHPKNLRRDDGWKIRDNWILTLTSNHTHT